MLRIDADLFFGNVDAIVDHLEQLLKERTANGQATRDVLLVMSAVSSIDTTGLYVSTRSTAACSDSPSSCI
jgi:SulP family sulfate permease